MKDLKPITPYLIFAGNCREAIHFYAEVFGGEITLLQTIGDSPIPAPSEASDLIFNSEMKAGELVLKASDNMPGSNTNIGNNISLFCSFGDPGSQQKVFDKLAAEGKVMFPLKDGFGMLKDRYGFQWMLAGKE